MRHLIVLVLGLILVSCEALDETIELGENDSVLVVDAITVTTTSAATVEASIVFARDSITERGIVWSLLPEPTLNDTVVTSGSGIGVFSVSLEDLAPNTTYYVRCYSLSRFGIAYSEVVEFKTVVSCQGEVYEGNLILESQSDVDAFGASNYCEITGSLIINQTSSLNPVTSLSSLFNITKINGLVINNTKLLTLNGLHNLEGVIKVLFLKNNNELIHLDALAKTVITDELLISDNESLLSIQGLYQLETISRRLVISNNPSLKFLNGFENLNSVANGSFIIEKNLLYDIEALQNLNTVFSLSISNEPNLQSLNGLSGLNSVETFLSFSNNNMLIDFCALTDLVDNGILSEANFIAKNNAYNPTYQDLLNGDCSQ